MNVYETKSMIFPPIDLELVLKFTLVINVVSATIPNSGEMRR